MEGLMKSTNLPQVMDMAGKWYTPTGGPIGLLGRKVFMSRANIRFAEFAQLVIKEKE